MTRDKLNEEILSLRASYSTLATLTSTMFGLGSCLVKELKIRLFLTRGYIELLSNIKLPEDPDMDNGCYICYNDVQETSIDALINAANKQLNVKSNCNK